MGPRESVPERLDRIQAMLNDGDTHPSPIDEIRRLRRLAARYIEHVGCEEGVYFLHPTTYRHEGFDGLTQDEVDELQAILDEYYPAASDDGFVGAETGDPPLPH